MNLFINLYRDKNPLRQKELEKCISINLLNERIEKLYCVIEGSSLSLFDFGGCGKVVFIHLNNRPTYNDFFESINRYANGKGINAITNSDIYFDEECVRLIEMNIKLGECYALTRWDILPNGLPKHFFRHDSQDTWVFKGKIKPVPDSDFTQARPGCDNAIADRLEKAGYKVLNPSVDIRTYHLHNTNIRNYTANDRIPPPYKLIQPHKLEPLNWINEIKTLKGNNLQSQYSEDIIINHIFKNIGTSNKFFVDLGAGAYDGKMSNTRTLKHNEWDGIGIDMADTNDDYVVKHFIKPDNICRLLNNWTIPKSFDFLNLDIDSSDYWVLKELLNEYSPRVICTEFNGTLNPHIPVALEYEDGYTWDKTNKYGYSFAAGKKLLEEKGYKIIYNLHDTNIFAVKEELVDGIDFVPVTAQKNIYHPVNPNAKWIGV